jgi:hypothetical protein
MFNADATYEKQEREAWRTVVAWVFQKGEARLRQDPETRRDRIEGAPRAGGIALYEALGAQQWVTVLRNF